MAADSFSLTSFGRVSELLEEPGPGLIERPCKCNARMRSAVAGSNVFKSSFMSAKQPSCCLQTLEILLRIKQVSYLQKLWPPV